MSTAAAIAKQGTERYDMPDDVKKKLYGMIARSCVGFERAQVSKPIISATRVVQYFVRNDASQKNERSSMQC